MAALKGVTVKLEALDKSFHRCCCHMPQVGRLKHISQLARNNRALRGYSLALISLLIKQSGSLLIDRQAIILDSGKIMLPHSLGL